MSGLNQPIRAAMAGIEWHLKPGTTNSYRRLLVGGMDALMHGGGHDSLVVALKGGDRSLEDCAVVALDLCFLLRKQDNYLTPSGIAVAAARALMLYALAYLETAGAMRVSAALIDQAYDEFRRLVFKRLALCKDWPKGATSPQSLTPNAYAAMIERAVAAVVWLPIIPQSKEGTV
jgi:hypothetical protein